MKNLENKVEEFIRVDHAGERGAVKIYEGQLLALNTLVKDENLKKTIEEMKIHEKEHCEFFENEIKKESNTANSKLESFQFEVTDFDSLAFSEKELQNIYSNYYHQDNQRFINENSSYSQFFELNQYPFGL